MSFICGLKCSNMIVVSGRNTSLQLFDVFYYGGKTFWFMEEYRDRRKEGIDRLINPMFVSYSAMTLLPYSDEAFSGYQNYL